MSNVPYARELIGGVVDKLPPGSPERNMLVAALDLLYRSPPARRAPRVSRPMTASMAERARELARLQPDTSIQDIAARLGVNAGRVSEAINRHR